MLALVATSAVVACSGAGITSQPLPLTATHPTTTARGTTATTGVPAAVPPGFTSFTSGDDHFSIAVPLDWEQIDPTGPDATQSMEEMLKHNEKLAPMRSSLDLLARSIEFFAVDEDGDSVYVLVRPALGTTDADLPRLAEAIKAQYGRVGVIPSSEETVRLSGHRVQRLAFELELALPGGDEITLPEVQHLLLANDLLYIVTFTGESPHFPTIISTFTVT